MNLPAPPKFIKPVGQLFDDLIALHQIFDQEDPPIIQDRVAEVRRLLCGFGDASGGDLGSSFLIPNLGVKYRIGVWGSDIEYKSSNYREFRNLVEKVEEEERADSLIGALFFLFTDNSTVESVLYQGNSSSQKLFELVVRLRKIQMSSGAKIVVSHISGKRMIPQGTDGLSRGNIREGVVGGKPMLSFIPLRLSAIQRHPPIVK